MSDQREHKSFISRMHIDPTISVTHLFTTLGLVTGVFVWGMSVSVRLAVIETSQQETTSRIVSILENQRLVDIRQDTELSETRRILREDMRDINAKLDSILRVTTGQTRQGESQ